MAKVSLRLDTRRARADGTFPLKVAVARDGRTSYVPLNVTLHRDEWDRNRLEVVKRPDRRTLNIYLQDKITSLKAELLKLQLEGRLRLLTDAQLIAALTGDDKNKRPTLLSNYYTQFVSTIHNRRTKELYEATEKKARAFAPDWAQLRFEDITNSWLRAFEAFLAENGSRGINSRSIHFRNLRAVFNAALDDHLITCYPFRGFKIRSQATEKRALSLEEMRLLLDADVEPHQRKYVDMFFLGFYLIGINVVDMAVLQEVKQGRITYERAKTHKLYSIKVEPEAQEIIERYPGNKSMLSFFDKCKNYRYVANRQNYNLGLIGERLGIKNLTYYCCRHTWATLASDIDIPDDVIALALGHSRSTVTDVYIRRNRLKVDEANRKVIDYLLEYKKI